MPLKEPLKEPLKAPTNTSWGLPLRLMLNIPHDTVLRDLTL